MIKNLLSIFAIALFVSSCTKTTTEQNHTDADTLTTVQNEPVFSYDSLRIGDSLEVSPLVTAKYAQKVLVFKGLEKNVLDSLYSNVLFDSIAPPIAYEKLEVEKLIQEKKDRYYQRTKKDLVDFQPGSKQTWDEVSEMNVVSELNDYLTVKYTGYGYTGGAHGYAYELYKVADLKTQTTVKLSDIVEVAKVDWNKILLQYADERKDGLFEPEKLSYNQNFHFDSTHLIFTYNQYEIAAYVYGIISIKVPFETIKEHLTPQFKQRMGFTN